MRLVLQKFFQSVDNKRILIIAALVFSIIQLALSVQLLASTLKYDRIYKGIYIRGVYVSGMTVEQAGKLLKDTYIPRLQAMKIRLKSGNDSQKVTPSKLIKETGFQKSVQMAFDEGRKGNAFVRLADITNNSMHAKTIDIDYDYDEAKLQEVIGRFSAKITKQLEQSSYQIQEDKIILKLGTSGVYIDEAKLRQQIIDRIENLEAGDYEVPTIVKKPDLIDIDYLHKKVYKKEKNATFKVVKRKLTIVPEEVGRDFDVAAAKRLISEKQNIEGSIIEIPIIIKYPKVGVNSLDKGILKDQLSQFSTHYGQGDRDRSNNIKIAASKINDVVLAPGDVFSYNEVVGRRTIEEGFKKAHVYAGGKVIDGIGGGICQVSTTLYNAVLLADLQVVERRNHNMIVGYVRPGRDATVSYGSIDFKFKNNTSTPIKIKSSAENGNLSIRIMGKNEHPGRSIDIETEILGTYSLKEKVINDSTKPIGYYKVVQKGMKGYKANAYKIVKQNGKSVSRTLISTNKYKALQRIVVKGTKK